MRFSEAELAQIEALAAEKKTSPETLMVDLAQLGIERWESEGVPRPPVPERSTPP